MITVRHIQNIRGMHGVRGGVPYNLLQQAQANTAAVDQFVESGAATASPELEDARGQNVADQAAQGTLQPPTYDDAAADAGLGPDAGRDVIRDIDANLAPKGSFLKTWGPPIAAAVVIVGAIWVLRR